MSPDSVPVQVKHQKGEITQDTSREENQYKSQKKYKVKVVSLFTEYSYNYRYKIPKISVRECSSSVQSERAMLNRHRHCVSHDNAVLI